MKIIITVIIFATLISGCDWNRIPESITVSDALELARESLKDKENISIFDNEKLTAIDTAVFYEGQFSPGKKREILVMCYEKNKPKPCNSNEVSPPPFETSDYLLMKLIPKRGKWVADWVAQENRISKQNIFDIDNDQLDEIIFNGEYSCRGGMTFGYYYIMTFKNDNAQIIYQKVSENQLTTWPNPNVTFYNGAVLIDEMKVRLEDVDNDSIMEIIEERKVLEYNGGQSLQEINDSAIKHRIIDTVFLKELEFEKEFD